MVHLAILLLAMFSYNTRTAVAFTRRTRISRWLPFAGHSATTQLYRRMAEDASNQELDADDTRDSNLVQRQKATSFHRLGETSTFTSGSPFLSAREHLSHQKEVFDDMVDYFEQDIPADLVPVYQYLADLILRNILKQREKSHRKISDENTSEEESATQRPIRILDVACGTGVLFDFLQQATVQHGIELSIVGVDLSPSMIKKAQKRLDNTCDPHNVELVESDILQYEPAPTQSSETTLFDAVIANACFGNFWNGTAVLEHVVPWLRNDEGLVFVTHPLGTPFVEQLHREDPSTVPNLLPTENEWHDKYTRYLPLELQEPLLQEVTLPGKQEEKPFYFASLVRVRHVGLRTLIRLRGSVDTGYGRGGKKLGFPTANLPSRYFQNALKDIPTGVYFGWAVIEHNNSDKEEPKAGCNERLKAVVNIGYSPTFEGKENQEKIVEAHLILGDRAIDDFYGETMRLQLHGFLRPEIKFPSFPALIAQITADRDEAERALDLNPSSTLRVDPFLATKVWDWVGASGGDASASYEFESMDEAIASLSAK